jgi:hypothetical protein
LTVFSGLSGVFVLCLFGLQSRALAEKHGLATVLFNLDKQVAIQGVHTMFIAAKPSLLTRFADSCQLERFLPLECVAAKKISIATSS